MKKVLLISVSTLALSAGAAFAQPPSTADVTGAYDTIHTATGTVVAGTPAASPSVSVGNSSTITQIGSGNQVGTSTATGVNQIIGDSTTGDGNLSVINQGVTSPGNASYNAYSQVSQTVTGGGKASSLINQDSGASGASTSIGNWAGVSQTIGGVGSATSTSTVNQSGTALYANVTQGASGSPVNSVSSYVGQSGSGASANVSQTVSGATSNIIQSGTGTWAGGAAGTGAVYNASVTQSGGSDTSGISQISTNIGTATVT